MWPTPCLLESGIEGLTEERRWGVKFRKPQSFREEISGF